jgi:hypothetical protein
VTRETAWDLVRDLVEAVNANDVSRLLAFYADDADRQSGIRPDHRSCDPADTTKVHALGGWSG